MFETCEKQERDAETARERDAERENEREMGSSVNLEDVPTVDLMTETLRRLKCSTKPDKRLILVGNHPQFPSLITCSFFKVLIFAKLYSDVTVLCS